MSPGASASDKAIMSNQRKEIKETVVAALCKRADGDYGSRGFVRRIGSLRYGRKLDDCTQSVEVCIEHAPRDNPDAAAAVYPWLSVRIPDVDRTAIEMTTGNETLLSTSAPTLRQPIEFVAPKGIGVRWYIYQRDSVVMAVAEFVAFSKRWLFQFLEEYSNARGVVRLYANGDERVLHDRSQFLRVIAAMVHCDEMLAAKEVLNDKFGRLASRRQFAPVFEYIEKSFPAPE